MKMNFTPTGFWRGFSMKLINSILSITIISTIISSMAISAEESARSARFIVEFNKQLSAEKIQQLIKANSDIIKISSFDNIKSDYFSRLYNVDLKISNGPQNNIRTIRNISGVVNVEEVFEFEPFSIIPNRSSDIHYSNDPLTIYQWGLFNHGQIIQYDVDDIHYEQVAGDEKTDIGVKKIFSTMGKNSDKKIVVAILDSGIDIDHSDIKKNKIIRPRWPSPTDWPKVFCMPST